MIIYNPMTPKEVTSVFLVMFTVVCALPAGVAVIPSAIAQEDDDMSLDEEENLASGTVSNVLDNVNTAGDGDTNTQVSVPLRDQDQRDANLGLNGALDVIEEEPPITPTPPEEEPPEDEDAFFCLVDIDFGVLCFNTLDECEFVEDLFRPFIVSECEEFETPPSDAVICRVVNEEINLEDCVPVQP